MSDRTPLTISLGQMDVRWGDPEANLSQVRSWTAEAARRGSQMVVFPELWDTGYALDRAVELGSDLGGGRFAIVSALAREYGLHIVGSLLELGHAEGTTRPAYNTAVWFGPDGRALGSYRKVHLFRGLQEDRYLLPGGVPHWIAHSWGAAGMAICYDLRFPELFRVYALGGVTLTVIPAQWPLARIEHWRTLLRARAIENQMVIVACNRVGISEDIPFGGHSAVIDAWGVPLVEAGEDEDLLTVTVDLAHTGEVRRALPVFEDRRPDIYML